MKAHDKALRLVELADVLALANHVKIHLSEIPQLSVEEKRMLFFAEKVELAAKREATRIRKSLWS